MLILKKLYAIMTGRPIVWLEADGDIWYRVARRHPDGETYLCRYRNEYGNVRTFRIKPGAEPGSTTGGGTWGWIIPPKQKEKVTTLDYELKKFDELSEQIRKTLSN